MLSKKELTLRLLKLQSQVTDLENKLSDQVDREIINHTWSEPFFGVAESHSHVSLRGEVEQIKKHLGLKIEVIQEKTVPAHVKTTKIRGTRKR